MPMSGMDAEIILYPRNNSSINSQKPGIDMVVRGARLRKKQQLRI
jgi:hypothetical protein